MSTQGHTLKPWKNMEALQVSHKALILQAPRFAHLSGLQGAGVGFTVCCHDVQYPAVCLFVRERPFLMRSPVSMQVRKLRHPNIVAALKHATVINQVRSCSP